MKKTTILMAAAISLLCACSKDKGNDDSDPLKEAARQLQTTIVGKWEFQNISLEGAPKLNQIAVAVKDRHRLNGIVLSGTDPGGPGNSTGYIEFLSDSTYMLYDSEGRYFQGKFQANTGDSISLAGLGSLGGIKLADGNLDFKLYYSAGSKSIVVSGNKAASIPMDTRTTQLCRAWYLTREADGEEAFEDSEEYNEETQQYEPYQIDSLGLIMTTSGTYIVQEFFAGKLLYAEVANWKWHSTKSDRFVYYWYNEEPDEDRDYIIITELNSTVLKAYEEWDDDNDGTIDTEWNYVFRPARQ